MTHRERGRTSPILVIVLVAFLAAGLAVYGWWNRGERKVVQIYDPANRQLVLERLHIAERWLKQQSRSVVALETLQFLDAVPAAGQHLVILSAPSDLSLLEASQLHDWVLRGGHLIARAPMDPPPAERPHNLNPFGIGHCLDCLSHAQTSNASEAPMEDKAGDAARVSIEGLGDRPLRLWSSLALAVDRPSGAVTTWESSQGATMLARYALGDGQVTLLPANQWLDNAQMIEPDHVRLLKALVADRDGTVFLQHYSIPGGLLPWLWRQAPPFWIACLILLALGVWSRMPRLGAIAADPEPPPNQLSDRLRATARFDAKHNDGRILLEAMRDELADRARTRYPDWHQLSVDERAARLARLCPEAGIASIRALLEKERIDPADRLIEDLALQRRLLRAL